MGTISDCLHLNVKKFIYMFTLYPKVSKQNNQTFLIEDFFHLPPVSTTLWCTLSCKDLCEFWKKFKTTLIRYSGAWGKLKLKIMWHCPFNCCSSCCARRSEVARALGWSATPSPSPHSAASSSSLASSPSTADPR
jgi:hypothetical protein